MLDPEDHRRSAVALEAVAADLPRLLVDVAAFHRPDVWTGRRADRLGHELEDRHRQLRVTAEELRAQAAELRRYADLQDLLRGPGSPI